MLQNFDATDLQRRFDANLNKLAADFDFDFGKASVLQEVAKAKRKPAEARAVVQIGIVIGRPGAVIAVPPGRLAVTWVWPPAGGQRA